MRYEVCAEIPGRNVVYKQTSSEKPKFFVSAQLLQSHMMSKLVLLPSLLLNLLLLHVRAAPTAASCSTTSFSSVPPPPGTAILALDAAVVTNYVDDIDGESNNWLVGNITGLNFCQVNVTLTHPGTGDSVNNQIWLPLAEWNGRFLGVGGGGYSTGTWSSLGPAVQTGYAAVSTEAGHSQNYAGDASTWALVSPGNVNQYLLLDFASRSVHDMTVLGKAVTEAFYAAKPAYSYWQGCSTGGRQGLGEAQMYPEDYDGIVAGAPAVQWNDFVSITLRSFIDAYLVGRSLSKRVQPKHIERSQCFSFR